MQEAVILLVEGKGAGGSSMGPALEKAGYVLQIAHTGAAAIALAKNNPPNLVVFDASAMRSSGARSCLRLRRALGETPIIHSRTADSPEDRAAEADVYLAHPYTSRKLINRIKSLLPADKTDDKVLRCGPVTLYRSKPSVEVNEQGERRLTPKLAHLLEEFIIHPNEVVSRRQLMLNVWKTDYVGDTRTLDVHIRWMREMIEDDPASPKLLRTVRGKGYIFKIPELLTEADES